MSQGSVSLLVQGVVAAAALNVARWVTFSGAYPAAGGSALGVSRAAATAAGQFTPLDVIGTSIVEAGGVVTAGSQVMADAQGRAVDHVSGNTALGLAFTSALVAGARVEVMLYPQSTSAPANGGSFTAVELVATVAGETTAADSNAALLQAAINFAGYVSIFKPGVYCISTPQNLVSNLTLYLARGVVLVKTDDPTHSCTMFQNSNMAGGNVNIALIGEGVIYCNANAYAGVYDANPADCPLLPAVMRSVAALVEPYSNLYQMNGIHLENVRGFRLGAGLTVMMANKYNVYGASLSRFDIDDLNLYSDDTVNPANGSTLGRDGIHIQGLTSDGTIRNIKGTVNDDGVVLNCRDIEPFTSARSIGHIRNVTIEKIRLKNQRRAGSNVIVYGGCDTGTLSGGKDTCPAITGIVQAGTTVTVTFAAAHRMFTGQEFSITGSNPAAYNVTNAAASSVPTATTMTFELAAGAGAYVGGAVGKRFYSMHGITVRDVDGETFSGSAVSLSTTTDTALNSSVLHNLTVDNVSVKLNGASGPGVVSMNNTRAVNPTFKNAVNRSGAAFPLYNFSITPTQNSFGGTALIENSVQQVPYKPDSGSGQGCINLPVTYEQILVKGGSAALLDGGGGWVNCIEFGGSANGSVVVEGFKVNGAAGSAPQLARSDSVAMGSIEIRGCEAGPAAALLQVGGAVTSGKIKLAGNTCPARNAPLVNYYGTGVTMAMFGNVCGNLGGQGVISAFTSGTLTVLGKGNDFGASYLITPGSTFAASGVQLRTEYDSNVDGSAAYIGTNQGNTFWNYNTAFGAGVGQYARTAAGVWSRIF